MSSTIAVTSRPLRLRRFSPVHALEIAHWVQTSRELRWLAPSTAQPLTADKVLGWKRPGGRALILGRDGDPRPMAYGELNPTRRDPDRLWVGHVVLRPTERRRGMGRWFVRRLVDYAFDHLVAKSLSLVVFPDNQPALRCYQSAGFVVAGDEYHRFKKTGPPHRLLRLEMHAG